MIAAAPESAELPRGRETILVVEDDAAVRGMVVSVLEGLGYDVRQATDGNSAFEMLRTETPVDLLFTDMVMPKPLHLPWSMRLRSDSRQSLDSER